MSATCEHVMHMSKMIQMRHVPDDLHRPAAGPCRESLVVK